MQEAFFDQTDLIVSAQTVMDKEAGRGHSVPVHKALGTALCEEGKAGVTNTLHLAHYEGSGVSGDINAILKDLPPHQVADFIQYWSAIFVGVAAPTIMEVSGNGWSTQAFFSDFESRITGTQVPALRLRGPATESDQVIEQRITQALIRNHNVGHFFRSWDNMAAITPIAVSLERYDHAFRAAILRTGTAFQKSLEAMQPKGQVHHA